MKFKKIIAMTIVVSMVFSSMGVQVWAEDNIIDEGEETEQEEGETEQEEGETEQKEKEIKYEIDLGEKQTRGLGHSCLNGCSDDVTNTYDVTCGEGLEEAVDNANSLSTDYIINIISDITISKGIVFNNTSKEVTINGNNKTITFDVMSAKTHPIAINNTEVTIKDLTIERNDSSNVFATIGFSNAKKLDLSGSTITVPQFDEDSISPHKNASGIGINGKCENIIFKNNTFKNATTLTGDQLSKAPMYIMARENDKILLEGNTFEGNYRESVTFEINAAGMKINVIKNTFKNNICPTEGTFITSKSYPSPYQIQFKPQTSYKGLTKLEGLIEENIFVAGETYTFPIGITLNKASDMDISNIEFKNNIFPKQPEEITSIDIGWLAAPLKNVIQKDKISYPGIMVHEKANCELPTKAKYVNSVDETKYSVWSHYESYFRSNMYFYNEIVAKVTPPPTPTPTKIDIDIIFEYENGVRIYPEYTMKDANGKEVTGTNVTPGAYFITYSLNGIMDTKPVTFNANNKKVTIYLPMPTSENESSSSSGGGGFSGTGTLIVGDGTKKDTTTKEKTTTTTDKGTTTIQDDRTPLGEISSKFKDVPKNHWANNAIEILAKKGIITGFENNDFRPNDNVTRGQFSLMILKGLNFKKSSNIKSFMDVKKTDWFFDAVDILSSLDIINGFEDGTFKPNQNISREQMAVVIFNSLEKQGIELEAIRTDLPKDFNKVASYAQNAVKSLYQSGLINGVGDNLCMPKANATRAESAMILNNLLSKAK